MSLSINELLEDPSKVENLDFEEGLEIINLIIDALSKRERKLTDLVKLYEIGTKLSQRLFNILREAESQIEVLKKNNDQLVSEIKNFEDVVEQIKSGSSAR